MLPTVNVRCVVYDQQGKPVKGATVSAKLSALEINTGYIFPEQITGITDETGQVILAVWPNELGAVASHYTFKISNPDTCKTEIINAVIPNHACDLHLVADTPPFIGKTAAQISLAEITAAAAIASSSASAIVAQVAGVNASVSAVNTAAATVHADSLSAATSANIATTKAAEITTAVASTATNAATAATKANDATAAAALAVTKASEALASQVSATASVTSTTTKATEAAASATAALASKTDATLAATSAATSKDAATVSAATASTKATEASTSATSAASSATTATTKAASATTSAANAATSATNAAASVVTANTKAGDAAASQVAAATSAATATTKASEAATAAVSANTAKDTATIAANTAVASKDAAGVSATTATTQANIAITKAGEAQTSAIAAAEAAASAVATVGGSSVTSVNGRVGAVVLAQSDVGLGNVNNTSDANKPVSTAQATAISGCAPLAHVGSGGAVHTTASTTVAGFLSASDKTKLDGIAVGATVAPVSSVAGRTGVIALTKADVGLGNVENTTDANKPVSTAQATAIALKINTAAKDTSDGIPGLTQFKLNMRNAANTFTSWFTNSATAARTWVLPDKDGTVAMLSDIQDTSVSILASEALTDGDLCNLWDNAGVINVRKADATIAGKEAHHFVLGDTAALALASVCLGVQDTRRTGLTPGKQYLSTVPGKTQSVPPTGSGQIVQVVGVATSSTSLSFQPQLPITLA